MFLLIVLVLFCPIVRCIFNGTEMSIRDAPLFAKIEFKFPQRTNICGGAIVFQNWVLTSARCAQFGVPFQEPQEIMVRYAGCTLAKQAIGAGVYYRTEYSPNSLRYGMAMVRTRFNLSLDRYARIATLAVPKTRITDLPDIQTAFIVGVGQNSPGASVDNCVLRMALIKIAKDPRECFNSLSDFDKRWMAYKSMQYYTYCLTNESNAGPCYRDGGGPVWRFQPPVGITLYGIMDYVDSDSTCDQANARKHLIRLTNEDRDWMLNLYKNMRGS